MIISIIIFSMFSFLFTLQELRTNLQNKSFSNSLLRFHVIFLTLYLLIPPIFSWYEKSGYLLTDLLLSLAMFVAMLLGGYIGFRTSDQPFLFSTFIQVTFAVTWRLTLIFLIFGLIFFYTLEIVEVQRVMITEYINIAITSSIIGSLLFVLPLAIQYVSLCEKSTTKK